MVRFSLRFSGNVQLSFLKRAHPYLFLRRVTEKYSRDDDDIKYISQQAVVSVDSCFFIFILTLIVLLSSASDEFALQEEIYPEERTYG